MKKTFMVFWMMLANIIEFAAFRMGVIKTFARIQLASNNDDIRGKIGGIVYSKGRSVHTQRKRLKPFNPQTSYQTVVRALTKRFSQAWRSLDPSNILEWNDQAALDVRSNVFGGKYRTTGHKMFVAQNVESFINGGTVQIDSPFVTTDGNIISLVSIDPDSTGTPKFDVVIDVVPATDQKVIVFASNQMSAGISNFTGKHRRIGIYDATDFSSKTKNIIADYVARFGDLIADKKISVQCFYTNADAGQLCKKFKAGAALAKSVK